MMVLLHPVKFFLNEYRNISSIKAKYIFLFFSQPPETLGEPWLKPNHADNISHAAWHWIWTWKPKQGGSGVSLRLAFALVVWKTVEMRIGFKGSIELVQEKILALHYLLWCQLARSVKLESSWLCIPFVTVEDWVHGRRLGAAFEERLSYYFSLFPSWLQSSAHIFKTTLLPYCLEIELSINSEHLCSFAFTNTSFRVKASFKEGVRIAK